jgi:hypothetical protein
MEKLLILIEEKNKITNEINKINIYLTNHDLDNNNKQILKNKHNKLISKLKNYTKQINQYYLKNMDELYCELENINSNTFYFIYWKSILINIISYGKKCKKQLESNYISCSEEYKKHLQKSIKTAGTANRIYNECINLYHKLQNDKIENVIEIEIKN